MLFPLFSYVEECLNDMEEDFKLGAMMILPNELLVKVLEYSPPTSLLSLSCTCKLLNDFISLDDIWEKKAAKMNIRRKSERCTWKGTVMESDFNCSLNLDSPSFIIAVVSSDGGLKKGCDWKKEVQSASGFFLSERGLYTPRYPSFIF